MVNNDIASVLYKLWIDSDIFNNLIFQIVINVIKNIFIKILIKITKSNKTFK